MSVNHANQTVRRFEFSLVVGQLFLFVGLLALATALENAGSVFTMIMKYIVVFVSFGMSMVYSIAGIAARPKKPLQSDNASQVG